MKKLPVFCVFALVLLVSACVGAPARIEKPQYNQWHYTFSILLDPEKPGGSPKLDIALSLLYMEYPAQQAEYLAGLLYSTNSFEVYKDRIIQEQRQKYRSSLSDRAEQPAGKNEAGFSWRYAETVTVKEFLQQGIVVERDFDVYSGGAHPFNSKRYYVIDIEGQRQLKIGDLFANFQTDRRLRDVIYFELWKYNKLQKGEALSQGIFFTDEPELSFNFFIANEGLGLHWDPYQIAPYSRGAIEIIVPWQVIRPMMQTTGIELLAKFGIYLFV